MSAREQLHQERIELDELVRTQKGELDKVRVELSKKEDEIETKKQEHFIENLKESTIFLDSPSTYDIVKLGEQLLFTFPAIWTIHVGITFETDRTPIAVGPNRMFAKIKSIPVIKIFPHWIIIFQTPADNNCQVFFMLK